MTQSKNATFYGKGRTRRKQIEDADFAQFSFPSLSVLRVTLSTVVFVTLSGMVSQLTAVKKAMGDKMMGVYRTFTISQTLYAVQRRTIKIFVLIPRLSLKTINLRLTKGYMVENWRSMRPSFLLLIGRKQLLCECSVTGDQPKFVYRFQQLTSRKTHVLVTWCIQNRSPFHFVDHFLTENFEHERFVKLIKRNLVCTLRQGVADPC